MSNLLDLDDNFPQNPFEEGSNNNNENQQDEFQGEVTSKDFSPSEQPTGSPQTTPFSNSTPNFSSFGDSIQSDENLQPYGSSGYGSNNTGFGSSSGNDKSNIQSILQGDSLFSVPRPTENDEKLRIWRNNHNQELIKKTEESRQKTEEQRKKAQKELDEFYQKRKEQISSKQKENGESQKDFVHKREEVEKLGNKWERVRHLIDVKGTEKSTDSKDTSRFRSVLIKMWNKK
eukprot:TRINITY_DN3356_c0_g1_i1.p1 TRINITY_DN3356_c0_g1~~TRINITY_DN3356_c0_g1_i1.p1  ORF type:complete len:231 (-),score=89.96 TRINITY_DN3356_c0_g1_i1:76-768(-)